MYPSKFRLTYDSSRVPKLTKINRTALLKRHRPWIMVVWEGVKIASTSYCQGGYYVAP